jgi:rare lipoprotein A
MAKGTRAGCWKAAAASAAGLGVLCLGACASAPGGPAAPYRAANLRPYEVDGRTYRPQAVTHYEATGVASWYAYPYGTRHTASGEPFDGRLLTAAHKTLPLPCRAEVTNLDNGRTVVVRVNDRGPFVSGRLIDLSPAAAERLGFKGQGVARVRVKFLGPAALADAGAGAAVDLLASTDDHGEGLF